MTLQTNANIMKDKGLDKGLIREFDTSERSKKGWSKGLFSFRKMFWDYLKKLHVPFYDDCCPASTEQENTSPVRWNNTLQRLEKYNGSAWVDITQIAETTTTSSTTTTTTAA